MSEHTQAELDEKVAEAQGWIELANEAGGRNWYDQVGRLIIGRSQYRPSTDLNQAVAFAKWVLNVRLTHLGLELNCDCDTRRWFVSLIPYADQYREAAFVAETADNLAGAMCRVMLDALVGREQGGAH